MTKKISISMQVEDWEYLKKQAKELDLTVSQLIRKLIRGMKK